VSSPSVKFSRWPFDDSGVDMNSDDFAVFIGIG
jgi:hypothetical protein